MGAFGFALGQWVRVKHGAVSGYSLQGQQVAQVGFERLPCPLVAVVLRETVDVSETDRAEGASAGCQGAPAGGQRPPAATGRHRQRTGRQTGHEEDKETR